MKTPCPCCGADLDAVWPVLDLNSNTIAFEGESARLSPICAEIASVLLKDAPKTIAHDTMIARVWGALEEPDNPRNTLMVHVARLRPIMKSFGFTIKSVWGVGLRLERGT